MAITVTAKPHLLVPAFNDIYFGATSTQTAQPNFKYYITILVGSTTYVYALPARPSGDLVWNARKAVEKALSNYYPYATYGWQAVTNGILSITVNIGEQYGATPTIYVGTDYVFEIWNGALNRETRRTYTPTSVRYPNCLNKLPTTIKGESDKDIIFYFLQATAGTIIRVTVTTYDSGGNILGSYRITNPLTTVNTANKYICINGGWAGMSGIASGLVTVMSGVYPIITASVSYYNLAFTDGVTVLNYAIQAADCSPYRTDKKTLHYLNSNGAFDVINLYGNNRKSVDIRKTFYKGIDDYFVGSYLDNASTVITPTSPLDINKRVLSNVNEGKQTLQSGILTDAEIELYAECFEASKYHLQSDASTYQIVMQDDTNFAWKRQLVDKVTQLQLTISDGYVNRRQTV